MLNPQEAETDFVRFPAVRTFDYKTSGKRVADVVIAGMALILSAPFILLLLGIVALRGGRPLYSQPRIGFGGVPFPCYKIRSMQIGADQMLRDLLANDPAAAAEWAEHQKLTNDPRITRFGNFLRKTSLDELPQLWNVLVGDMSIVGPRPVVADELLRYGPDAEAYKSVRPGLTGPWQVSGRNQISYSERVALDAAYVRNVSFGRDLAIMLGTARSVVQRTGQ